MFVAFTHIVRSFLVREHRGTLGYLVGRKNSYQLLLGSLTTFREPAEHSLLIYGFETVLMGILLPFNSLNPTNRARKYAILRRLTTFEQQLQKLVLDD